MQKRTTFVAGAWMTGGLAISFFAGVASTVLIAVWLAVGVVVLLGVVLSSGRDTIQGELSEGLKNWSAKRRGWVERLLGAKNADLSD